MEGLGGELDRARQLLAAGIATLTESFHQLSRHAQLTHTPDPIPVGAAVRALQFEDMVTQLLSSAERRIRRLERAMEMLASEELVAGGSGQVEGLRRILDELASGTAGGSPVAQTSVDEGSVELF